MRSNNFAKIIPVSLGVLGLFFCIGFFSVFAISSDFEEIDNGKVETSLTTQVTTFSKITTTETTTIAVTSTEKSLTSPTTTVKDINSEITLCEDGEPENDLIEPDMTIEDFQECEEDFYEQKDNYSTYSGITDEEYRMLVLTVYLEAGNQSLDCKKGIASVVMNRVNLEEFPDSVYSVLTQEEQFTIDFSRTDIPDSECYEAVDYVLNYGSIMPEEVKVFYADYCTDDWLLSRPIYCQIGDVVFAY